MADIFFRVLLACEDSSPGSGAVETCIRKMLETIQQAREDASFDISCITVTGAGTQTSEDAVSMLGRQGDAVQGAISYGSLKFQDQIKGSRPNVRIPQLIPKGKTSCDGLADLDMTVFFLDDLHGLSDESALKASKDDVKHLVLASTAAVQRSEPADWFTIIRDGDMIEPFTTHCYELLQRSSGLPVEPIRHMSSHQALQGFVQDPASLNEQLLPTK
ncbi:uncharacterized protein LTR77_000932 [Saxophila tyrrhenica]|uniref:Uncharacterized protein n=1 Tax=Saxophila tyrrhenica TaxID=1690608 RepID=A0AAV9PSA1_9PEZI|nr:hypothetical protein LTR77_000932 [Saxophila tyrrhenica]